MPVKRERQAVPSRTWSCSELKDGHEGLLQCKKEHDSDLVAKIQDRRVGGNKMFACHVYCDVRKAWKVQQLGHVELAQVLSLSTVKDYERMLADLKKKVGMEVSWSFYLGRCLVFLLSVCNFVMSLTDIHQNISCRMTRVFYERPGPLSNLLRLIKPSQMMILSRSLGIHTFQYTPTCAQVDCKFVAISL